MSELLRVVADTNIYISALIVFPQVTIVAADDPDDNRVLECALAAGAQYIASGDRDLRRLGRFREISIVNPRQFLEAKPWQR